ncbi:MAG TPA: aspartate-semialdehyde dehydrogenase [Pirellulaceae bacterium]|nr:aspartate-semialdehyde dehydrogenase [Pirellulaceae bacterium]HMO91214.1 aspartate-semialdehyde dehydrogenase [Pirellulaceae bacterium]HMP70797.1 aspartate-semialdehyde dehydrogenase [Pirellulaceae bacterium]
MGLRIGIAGASGAVGRIICEQLAEFEFEADEIRLLASPRSVGETIVVHGKARKIALLSAENIQGLDLLIASTPDDIATEVAEWCLRSGVTMIDESAAHRMLEHVPLVVPEVNSHELARHTGIIASPNCSTTQLVMCLKPIHDVAGLKRVIVSTYQAASGAGAAGVNDLIGGTRAALEGTAWEYSVFNRPLAFNLIPNIGSVKPCGATSEELKMVHETRKILDAPELAVTATCIRVPVVQGHSESVYVECEREIDAQTAARLFQEMPGVTLVDDANALDFPNPLMASGKNDVFVGRIRQADQTPNAIAFWCVSDNLRKGAATNALQIAACLMGLKCT